LGHQRKDGESNFNSGDGTGQMAKPWMFMMMMIMINDVGRRSTLAVDIIIERHVMKDIYGINKIQLCDTLLSSLYTL
jgi:hypothetical protein